MRAFTENEKIEKSGQIVGCGARASAGGRKGRRDAPGDGYARQAKELEKPREEE